MRAGSAFQRQGQFPAEKPALGQALALLEQRAADKFDALDRNGGDVIGNWIALEGIGFEPSKLGNGRISGKWRKIGLGNAGFRLFLEVGATTVFAAFGFSLRPPPGYAYDTSQAIFQISGGTALFPITIAGVIGGVFTGRVSPAIMTSAGIVVLLGVGITTLAAGDQVTMEVEIPVKKAG